MTIIDGVLQTGIPWELIFVGVFFGVIIELLSLPSLPFAVGLYLPITSMTPIFLGGCIRFFVERKHHNNPEKLNRSRENGILFGSGLVGGEGFTMIIISLYAYYQGKPQGVGLEWSSPLGEIIAFILFALMGYVLIQRTQSK